MENKNDIPENQNKDKNAEAILKKPEKTANNTLKKEKRKNTAGADTKADATLKPEDGRKKGEKKKKEGEKTKKFLASTTLCKIVKKDFLKKHLKEYQAIVTDPEYICERCGRLAKNKRSLCRPVRLK